MLRGDPSLVLALYARLPADSMTRAQERDPDNWAYYMGADPTYYVLSAIYDAINVNTVATGWFAKGKAPKFEPWPIPESRAGAAAKKAERATVKGLFKAFGGQATAPKGGKAVFVPVEN